MKTKIVTPYVLGWTHQSLDGARQPHYQWAWGSDLKHIANALARFLVDTRGDAVVRSYA